MSTRGTYLLATSQIFDHSTCFYVHHDNYPEGAAHYFRQMHYYKNSRGHYAGRFFQANINAEFTDSHDAHGDTEYRYTLDAQGQLTVLHETINAHRHWVNIYKGSWYKFVNQQLPNEEKLYLFKSTDSQEVMTLTEAKKRVSSERVMAKNALENGCTDNVRFHNDEAKLFQIQVDIVLQDTKFNNGKTTVRPN